MQYKAGKIHFVEASAELNESQRNELASQALFLRAYHYFNLLRLFGGVFLVSEPLEPQLSKQVQRASLTDTYAFVEQDLLTAIAIGSTQTYSAIPNTDLGRANAWSAKALLAKLYLSLESPQPDKALLLLDDIILHSGYALEADYDKVFSTNNEMNREILFAVRYKAGLVGLGNPMANLFAPASSGDAIINGDGNGFNYPTNSINAAYITNPTIASDKRKGTNIAIYTNSTTPLYVNKFMSKVLVKDDAENDFPIIRFADVLLMKAEAMGYDGGGGEAVELINSIRRRAGAVAYTSGNFIGAFYLYPIVGPNAINSEADFVKALLLERRLELAFENQRFFDLQRLGKLVEVMQAHYAAEYSVHYGRYRPVIPLTELQANVAARTLLPIPQREIDNNTLLTIPQNPGY